MKIIKQTFQSDGLDDLSILIGDESTPKCPTVSVEIDGYEVSLDRQQWCDLYQAALAMLDSQTPNRE